MPSEHSSSGTDQDNLVTVDSESHEGEWLRMKACPIPNCDAVLGKEYKQFSTHLAAEHGPEDIGLSSDGRHVATDGGTSSSGVGQTDTCPRCGGTARFTDGRGPYCRSCGWCAERPPRPLRTRGEQRAD